MLVKEIVPTEQVVDILCDVCGRSTKTNFGTNQYGSLSADFGYGSRHDGERYQVHLCEMCFFGTLATMREMHRGNICLTMTMRLQTQTHLGVIILIGR
jgi:hypothetical protein